MTHYWEVGAISIFAGLLVFMGVFTGLAMKPSSNAPAAHEEDACVVPSLAPHDAQPQARETVYGIEWRLSDAMADRLNRLLEAIEQVESGGDNNAVGSHGELGAYQIMPAYHFDAWEGVDDAPTFEQMRDPELARQTVIRYWARHEPHALRECDERTLALLHHRGPAWRTKKDDGYWAKVQGE